MKGLKMKDLKDKFKRAGGVQILKQYAKAHVLGYAMLQAALNGTSQKSLEIVRLSVNNKVLGKLRKKYSDYIREYLTREGQKAPKERVRTDHIWILWLDGLDSAPEVVKACVRSVTEHFPDKKVHILTEDNYREYVTFPPFIQEKIDSGVISKTHMSDRDLAGFHCILHIVECALLYDRLRSVPFSGSQTGPGRSLPAHLQLDDQRVHEPSHAAPDTGAPIRVLEKEQ